MLSSDIVVGFNSSLDFHFFCISLSLLTNLCSLSLRLGVRYAKVLTPGSDVKEAFVIEPETLNWMDGLVAVGISL